MEQNPLLVHCSISREVCALSTTLIILLLGYVTCLAQHDSKPFIIQEQLRVDSLKIYTPKKATFDFQFDTRHSWIQNQAITMEGFNPAILVRQKYRWGIGLYRVIQPYQTFRSNRQSSVNTPAVATNRELNLYFITPNFRYIFFRRKWIEASAELAIGLGTINYIIKNENNTKVLSNKSGLFIPASAGVEVVFIPIRWLGVGGSLGYRKSLRTYDINGDFDGLYFSYGLKVFLGTIYKDLKYQSHKKKIARDSGHT